ncbi:hypothetical protein D5E69_23060 (plasmid) [Rossellomorea marisflavi]|uniref:hypothetical protein n=1 Tax=Rossellomorea marisflavi TaxID=189381 RepID=UPI001316E1AB|nr:hypothetical protein [Rossellomorea marisflavi]QHA38716.1 hypothetical protein D5E69_23060 [Rossellomorea marisflavi]
MTNKSYEAEYLPWKEEIHVYERVQTVHGTDEISVKFYDVNEKYAIIHTIDGCYFCADPIAGTECNMKIFQNGRLRMEVSSATDPKFEISLNI